MEFTSRILIYLYFFSDQARSYLEILEKDGRDAADRFIKDTYPDHLVKEFFEEIDTPLFDKLLNQIVQRKHEPVGLSENKTELKELSADDCSKLRSNLDTFTLMVTNECNLACTYCYGNEDYSCHKKNYKMSSETMEKAIEYAFSISSKETVKFHFFGGEPLLEFDLLQSAVDSINQRFDRKASLGITTNCTLGSDRVLEFLKENNISITLSVDGPPELHSICRQPNSNYKIDSKLMEVNFRRYLEVFDKDLSVRCTVTSFSLDKPDELFKYFEDSGVKRLACTWVDSNQFSFASLDRRYEYEFADEHFGKMVEFEDQLAKRAMDHYLGKSSLRIMTYDGFIHKLLRAQSRRVGCGAGIGMLTIDSDGSIYPCYRYINSGSIYQFGNVNSVYNDEQIHQVDRFLRHLFNSTDSICSQCILNNLCAGACTVNTCTAFDHGHRDRQSSLHCRLMKRRFHNSLKIISQLTGDQIYENFKPGSSEELIVC